VCALHEQERTLVVSSRKSRKIQINFQLSKEQNSECVFFQGVQVPYARSRIRSISKSQGGIGRPMHRRKRDYKIQY
jgi:hypothetical protein